MKKPSALVALVIATAAGLSLVGCSSPSEPGGSETPTTAPTDGGALFSQELHDLLPESIREEGVLSIVGDPNAPWRVIDANNELVGFQPDLMEVFEEILGVEIEQEMVTGLPAVKLGIESGRNDAGFGPLLDTPTTEQEMTFIIYATARPTFLTLADSPVSSIMDLCGTTVSLLDGSVATERALEAVDEKCADDGQPAVDRLPLAETNATILAVQSGRADSASMGAAAAAYAISTQGDEFAMYVSSEDEFESDYVGMGVTPENEGLRDALLGAWEIAFEEGIYEELMAKYNLTDVMVDAPSINRATAS